MSEYNKLDKMKELTDKLEQGIKDVYTSNKYINYLNVMSKFHSYSFRNSILLMIQKPDATYVAGFNAWKTKFRRYVKKGEKGIQILAPCPYRVKVEMEKIDPKTQKPVINAEGKPVTELVEITKPAFRPVYVFDVSQTSGEPLPQLVTELTGNVEKYNAFIESLKSVSPFPMQFEDIQSGAKGYCDPVNQKIAIKEGMSEIHTIKTTIHEITHADLHADNNNLALSDKKDRRTKEVEAESVAFVVCSHYGIDTSEYSFAYVAAWSSDKELNELKNSLDTIQKQAAELIDRIDTRFQELLKAQQIEKNEPTKDEAAAQHLDSVKFDNDIDLDKERTRNQLGFIDNEYLKGNSDYYKMFYAGSGGQDNESVEYQKKTGWNRIWGSDNNGLNGNTWIVYRSVSDLPKWLQDFANYQEKHGLNVTANGENVKKPTMVERMAAAKETSKERATQNQAPKKDKYQEREAI